MESWEGGLPLSIFLIGGKRAHLNIECTSVSSMVGYSAIPRAGASVSELSGLSKLGDLGANIARGRNSNRDSTHMPRQFVEDKTT